MQLSLSSRQKIVYIEYRRLEFFGVPLRFSFHCSPGDDTESWAESKIASLYDYYKDGRTSESGLRYLLSSIQVTDENLKNFV
jgi:hypothetical protein